MQDIGHYAGRQVKWLDYGSFPHALPDRDWVCLAVANQAPDRAKFEEFVRAVIARGILEFKGHGKFGELLHDLFDEIMVEMEVMEGRGALDIMTTWHSGEPLADAFWQCFFATTLPENTDPTQVSVICTDLDGIHRTEEFNSYLQEFALGWLPSVNVKHEVWEETGGLTTLCLADTRGDDCRALLEPGSQVIHTFYAESHFEAMEMYYAFMDWGTYTSEFEVDRQPYPRLAEL